MKRDPLKQSGPIKVSVTLDAGDAEILREVMSAWREEVPGKTASWLLRIAMRRARRVGAAKFIDETLEGTIADQRALEAAPAAPEVHGLPEGVVSLSEFKNRREAHP